MKSLFWAFLERFAPRAGTALLMLVFAATSNPAVVGYYAAAMTGYMVLQSLTDGAAKRVAVSAVATVDGRAFLTKYKKFYALYGTLFLVLVLLLIKFWGAPLTDFFTLTPLLLLPVIMGSTIEPLAHLQRAGRWRRISFISTTSTVIALAFAFPLVFIYENALGSVLQLVITETLFAIRLRYLVRKEALSVVSINTEINYLRVFASTGLFIISIQGQYMLDRLLVGIFAGPGLLGVFNLGWSLSRGISDSLSTSTLNVLQAKIMDARQKSHLEIQNLVVTTLPKALMMTTSVVATVMFLSYSIAPHFLGPEWQEMLDVVPLMSLTALPSVCCYCLLPVLMYYERMRWAITPRIIGLGFSFGVGWAIQHSLDLAVWLTLIRESVSMLIMLFGARKIWSLKLLFFTIAPTATVTIIVALFYLL